MDLKRSEEFDSVTNFNFLLDIQSERDDFFKLKSNKHHSEQDQSELHFPPEEEEKEDLLFDTCNYENYQSEIRDNCANSSKNSKLNKREMKEQHKESCQSTATESNDYQVRLQKRKRQNRIAAQRSREKKKLKMEELETENNSLLKGCDWYRKVMDSYLEQLQLLRDDVSSIL